MTLDAHLREAHAGSLAAQAWSVTVQAWSVAAHAGLAQVRSTIEDLLVDLSENASIGAESGGYIFALDEETYGADEEAVELFWFDKLL